MGGLSTELRAFHSVCMEYDMHDSDPATIDLVCMFATFLNPQVVVEAGTYRGRMTTALANVLRAIGGTGVIYTADPTDHVSAMLALPELAPITPYIRYHQGDYLEMLGTIPGDIDLAYIDASHTDNSHMRWEHAMATFLRLRYGGLILVDDTAGEWEDAAKFRDLANIYLPGHRGLTIIQKSKSWD